MLIQTHCSCPEALHNETFDAFESITRIHTKNKRDSTRGRHGIFLGEV